MNKKSEIKNELNRTEIAFVSGKLSDEQYRELYVVQQTLSWAMILELAASPFDVVMNGKVWPPIKKLVTDTLVG